MTGRAVLRSGYLPALVAQPGNQVDAAAQARRHRPHDVDSGDLPVLDLGDAGLGYPTASARSACVIPVAVRTSELVSAHAGFPALACRDLPGRLLPGSKAPCTPGAELTCYVT